MTPSSTHLVLIPSYNPGPRLLSTARAALADWSPVWVVTDGSTDDSSTAIQALATTEPQLRVLVRPANGGKGAAVLTAAAAALAAGFTHALVLDADGQHPADRITAFMAASAATPAALIAGQPVFGLDAPKIRLYGRQLSVGLVHLETRGRIIADPLFGFRVYPLAPLVTALHSTRTARRYDFDPEVAVRLIWAGTPVQNLPATCRYLTPAEGGISHFHYVRDNLRMIWLHTRLLTSLLRQSFSSFFLLLFLPTSSFFRRVPVLSVFTALIFAITPPTRAANLISEPGAPLLLGQNDAVWRPLFTAIAAQGAVHAQFTEHRWFAIRREPTVLTGEMRLSPTLGLSLHYAAPDASTLIIDEQGLLQRSAQGRDRAAPNTPRYTGLTAALLPVLRFDLPALAQKFTVTAARSGDAWRLDFTPRDPELAKTFGRITVQGEATAVRRLEFRRDAKQRIEIFVGPATPNASFTEADVKKFFR